MIPQVSVAGRAGVARRFDREATTRALGSTGFDEDESSAPHGLHELTCDREADRLGFLGACCPFRGTQHDLDLGQIGGEAQSDRPDPDDETSADNAAEDAAEDTQETVIQEKVTAASP